MMHMGPVFSGMGMLFGWIWLLIPLLMISFGVRFLRGFMMHGSRGRRGVKGMGKSKLENSRVKSGSVQNRIMMLANSKGGLLTVTDVVLETGLPLKKVEKTLNSMVDGYRVNMQVKDSGMIVYEFSEIVNRKELENSGAMANQA